MDLLDKIQSEQYKRSLINRLNFEKADQNSLLNEYQNEIEIVKSIWSDNLNKSEDKLELLKSFSSDLKQRFPNGSWRTINGSHVFINNGKVIAGLGGFNQEIDKFFKEKKAKKESVGQTKTEPKKHEIGDTVSKNGFNFKVTGVFSDKVSISMADSFDNFSREDRKKYLETFKEFSKEMMKTEKPKTLDKNKTNLELSTNGSGSDIERYKKFIDQVEEYGEDWFNEATRKRYNHLKEKVSEINKKTPKTEPETKKGLSIKSSTEDVFKYFNDYKNKKVSVGTGEYKREGKIIDVDINLDGNRIGNSGVFVYFLEDGEKFSEKTKVNFSDQNRFTLLKEESQPSTKTEPETKKEEIPVSKDGLYQIYTANVRNRDGGIDKMYGVPSPLNRGKRGFGDDLVGTLEQAIKTVDYNRHQEGVVSKRKEEQQLQKQKEEEEKQAKLERNKGKTKLEIMNEAKDSNVLNTKLNYNGVIQTRREHTESVIKNGGHIDTKEVNKVKDVSRATYNRMNNSQQEDLERRIKRGGKKTEYRLYTKDGSFYDITRAEYNYAKQLESNK